MAVALSSLSLPNFYLCFGHLGSITMGPQSKVSHIWSDHPFALIPSSSSARSKPHPRWRDNHLRLTRSSITTVLLQNPLSSTSVFTWRIQRRLRLANMFFGHFFTVGQGRSCWLEGWCQGQIFKTKAPEWVWIRPEFDLVYEGTVYKSTSKFFFWRKNWLKLYNIIQ